MDKPSQFVKTVMTRYPSLYRNRAETIYGVMFNSGYEWGADGNLMHDSHFKDNEAQAIEKNLAEMRKAIEKKEVYESPLDAAFKLRAINNLRRYEFFLENADVIASSIHWYETDEYRIHYSTLTSMVRHMPDFGPIYKAPSNISPEWRDAIFEWIDSLMPAMRSVWGVLDIRDGWLPSTNISGSQCRVWHELHRLWRQYVSPANLDAHKALSEVLTEILNEK
jgi:hypothetical protein